MFKNVAGQKLTVYAFDSTTSLPETGDAANITAYVNIDDAGTNVLADTSATEISAANAAGYYSFDLAQAETNGDKLLFTAKSATGDIVVIGVPAVVYTYPTTGILAPTVAGRTLDVSATGEGGVDWANVGAPTTTLNLSGTTTKDLSATGLDNIVMSDITAVPAVNGTIKAAINWVFALMRNKRTETSTVETLFKDNGSTTVATSTKSDDGTTFTRGKYS